MSRKSLRTFPVFSQDLQSLALIALALFFDFFWYFSFFEICVKKVSCFCPKTLGGGQSYLDSINKSRGIGIKQLWCTFIYMHKRFFLNGIKASNPVQRFWGSTVFALYTVFAPSPPGGINFFGWNLCFKKVSCLCPKQDGVGPNDYRPFTK